MNTLLLACAALMSAADPIDPYIGANTVLVARVDLNKLTPTAITDTLKVIDPTGLDASQLAIVTATHAALTAAGVSTLNLVWNYDATSIWPIVLVPMGPNDRGNRAIAISDSLTKLDLRPIGVPSFSVSIDPNNVMMMRMAKTDPPLQKALPRTDLAFTDGPAIQVILALSDDMRKVMEEMIPPPPQRFGPIGPVIRGLAGANLAIELTPKLRVTARVRGKDAAAASAVAKILGDLRTEALTTKSPPEVKLIARAIEPVLRGDQVAIDLDMDALKGPLGEALRRSRAAATRAQSMNSLRQLALAMHNYHDVNGRFPADVVAKDGKPLLSWRVHLLPFLEQDALHGAFKLDEAWDSPHNKALLEKMPDVFRNTQRKDAAGHTAYFGPAGKGMLFDFVKPGEGRQIRDIFDGTSNTIMIVEANGGDAVPWTKPEPFVPDDGVLKRLLGARDGFNVAFGDGASRFIPKSVKPATLQALFSIGGGEVIEIP